MRASGCPPIAVPTCRKPGGLCWALHEFSHRAEASGLGKWVAGSQFLTRQESPAAFVRESSWSLGQLQKPGPRLKPRNAFKTAASNLDSGTFQGPTNIRVKVRQTEKVGAKADKDWAPGRTAPAHWSTVSSEPHLFYSYNQATVRLLRWTMTYSICRSDPRGKWQAERWLQWGCPLSGTFQGLSVRKQPPRAVVDARINFRRCCARDIGESPHPEA